MARWSLISAFIVGLVATSAATETVHLDGMYQPLLYEIQDVKRDKDTVEVNFAFYAPSVATLQSTKRGKFQVIMRSPMHLKFESDVKKFGKVVRVDSNVTELFKKTNPSTEMRQKINAKSSKSSCPVGNVLTAIGNLDKSFTNVMDLLVEGSDPLKDLERSHSSYQTRPSVVLVETDKIEEGYYTWTGKFKYVTQEKKPSELGYGNDGWILAVVEEGAEKPYTEYKNVCFEADPFSAVKLFKSLKSKAIVHACHGKNLFEFEKPSEKIVPMQFDVRGDVNEGKLSLKFSFTVTADVKKAVGPKGFYLRLELPADDEKSKLGSLPNDKIAEKFSTSTFNLPLNVSYDKLTNTLRLYYNSKTTIIPNKTYDLSLDITDTPNLLSQSGNFLMAIDAADSGTYVPALPTFEKALKSLAFSKFQTSVNKSPANYVCWEIITDLYTSKSGAKTQVRCVASSSTAKVTPTKTSSLEGTITTYAPGRYVLLLNVGSRYVPSKKEGYVTVFLPATGVSYDGTYLDTATGEEVAVGPSHMYDAMLNMVKVKVNYKNSGASLGASSDSFVIPIPFSSLESSEAFMDAEKWRVLLMDDSLRSIYTMELRLHDGIKTDEKKTIKGVTNKTTPASVKKCHYLPGTEKSRIVVAVDAVVAKNMLFTFTVSDKLFDKSHCSILISDDASPLTQVSCSDDGKSAVVYLNYRERYVNRRKDITFDIRVGSKIEALKKLGSMKITASGRQGEAPAKMQADLAAAFEKIGDKEDKLLESTIALKDVETVSNPPKPCFAKTGRLVSLNFDEQTRGVYYMTRIHDCKRPWLPARGFDQSEGYSFKIAQGEGAVPGHTMTQELYRLQPAAMGRINLEMIAMKSKKMVEHTLYVVFDKSSAAILLKQVKAAMESRGKTRSYSGDADITLLEKYLTEIPGKGFPNVIGDIKYAYYDESKSTLEMKRKAIFKENRGIKNEKETVKSVKDFKMAMEHILDDGFANIEPESMTGSFSVLAFASKANADLVKKETAVYKAKDASSGGRATFQQPILVKVYALDTTYDVKDSTGCKKFNEAFDAKAASATVATAAEVLAYLKPKSFTDEMYTDFKFSSKAAEIADTKTVQAEGAALKGSASSIKRLPNRKAFDVFFKFETKSSPICVYKHLQYDPEITDLMYNFVLYIRNNVATQNMVIAGCVKFEKESDYRTSKPDYTISYKGLDLLKSSSADSVAKQLPATVAGRCNIYALYEHLPRTLHHDKTVEHKTDIKAELTTPVLKNSAQLKKLIRSMDYSKLT
ncbi:WD repeat-containing protein 44 [Babesia caballi]|uniref:WD repeat-containing protein 44 n=1 Tax=Babesia caballi TaxID=5871 RepID=A0AAV4M208_BABCB|nr:WD repeat-containing protein 44 [Babesia caballi]